MTRKEIKKIIDKGYLLNNGDLADRILAAIENERKGDRTIAKGVCNASGRLGGIDCDGLVFAGEKGQLIFRPDTKEDK